MPRFFSDTCNVLSKIQMHEFPYPIGSAIGALPDYEYKLLAESRPDWKEIAEDKADENNKRVDWCGARVLTSDGVSWVWKQFIEYHTSEDFYRIILKHFGKYFSQYYPKIDFEKLKVGIRNSNIDGDIYLDCQIGINTPVKEKSTVSNPHLDHPNELWAGMLYMREPDDNAGGDLVICKCRDIPREYGKRQIADDDLIAWGRVIYEANSFVCFMNSPFSVHAVTKRKPTEKPRLLVNFSLEFKDKELFEIGRVRL